MAIPPAFDEKKYGELWSTNGLEFYVSLDPLKCTFLADYIYYYYFTLGSKDPEG